MTIELKIEKEKYQDKPELTINDTDYFGNKAKIVVELVSRWGMVAAMADGEDKAGRAKLRLATEQELVDRAMKIADLMFSELEYKEWLIQVPDFETQELAVQNILEENENENLAGRDH